MKKRKITHAHSTQHTHTLSGEKSERQKVLVASGVAFAANSDAEAI